MKEGGKGQEDGQQTGLSVAAQIAGESGAAGGSSERDGTHYGTGGKGNLSVPSHGREKIPADVQIVEGIRYPA